MEHVIYFFQRSSLHLRHTEICEHKRAACEAAEDEPDFRMEVSIGSVEEIRSAKGEDKTTHCRHEKVRHFRLDRIGSGHTYFVKIFTIDATRCVLSRSREAGSSVVTM